MTPLHRMLDPIPVPDYPVAIELLVGPSITLHLPYELHRLVDLALLFMRGGIECSLMVGPIVQVVLNLFWCLPAVSSDDSIEPRP